MTMKIEKHPRTDADVKLLCDVFPDLKTDGSELQHTQIEAVLGESRDTSRYRRVVNKWRRQLLVERGIWLDGLLAQGRGYVALNPDEMVRFHHRKIRSAGRMEGKGAAVASAADDAALSEGMRRYRGLLMVAHARMALERRHVQREVSKALRPQPQQPRSLPASA